MWVLKKNPNISGLCLNGGSWPGRGTVTTQSSAELLQWERDVDIPGFKVSQSQVYFQSHFWSWAPPWGMCRVPGTDQVPLGGQWGLELCSSGSVAPHSPPPATLQGGQVPGCGREGWRDPRAGQGRARRRQQIPGSPDSPSPGPAGSALGRGRGKRLRATAGEAEGAARRARLLVLSGRPNEEARLELDPPSSPEW